MKVVYTILKEVGSHNAHLLKTYAGAIESKVLAYGTVRDVQELAEEMNAAQAAKEASPASK